MSSSWQRPGLKSVGEYQLSGIPFVVPEQTASKTVTLSRVSKALNINVTAAGTSATIHFHDVDASGVAADTQFKLPTGLTRLEVRVRKFTITVAGGAKYTVVAELTDILAEDQQPLPLSTLGALS